MTAKPFKETVYNELQDDAFAAAYLNDAMADSIEEFLIALHKVVKARGGTARVAESAEVSREVMYRMLSRKGNPEFRPVQKMLGAMGFGFRVTTIPRKSPHSLPHA